MSDRPLQISLNCLLGHCLTHVSLTSFLWGIGKQNSPRCDFVLLTGISSQNEIKITTEKNESGHIQMIRMRKSIRHKWVNCRAWGVIHLSVQ